MKSFVVITIPKHAGHEVTKLEYEILEGLSEQLDQKRGKIEKIEILPDTENSLVHKVLVLVDSHEPLLMTGMNYNDK